MLGSRLRLKNFQRIAVVAAMIVLIFSGWPRVFNFPLPIQEALAAVPTYVDQGAFTSGAGALSVPPPAIYQDDDVFLLFVESANQTIATPTGWTEVTNSPQGTGSAGGAGGVRLAVFYKVVSGAQSNASVADSGDHTTAIIAGFRGVDISGPIHITAGSVDASATNAISTPSVTTSIADTMIVNAIGLDKDANDTTTLSGEANANLTNLAEQHDQTINTGRGGGLAFYTGEKAAAGAVGNTTATADSSTTHAYITVALKPRPVTTLGTGTDAVTVTVAPGSGIRDDGSFTFQTSAGTDSITALTVILAASGTPYNGLSEVRITNDAGTTTYFSAIPNPSSNTLNFSGGTPITSTTTQTQYKIRVTPKTHALMAAPPGAEYNLSPYVSVFTSTNTQAGSDSNANTLTIDNLSPNNATSTSGSAGDAQVTLNWTTSSSSDFNRSVVLRWAASTPGSEVPAEGTEYGVDNTIGTAIVACARNDAASTAVSGVDGAGTGGCSATALTNGQDYSYKVFQKDSRFNYDVGVTFTGSPFRPQTAPNPVPTTTSISPTSKTVGDLGFTMTVNGTNFVSSSVVKFDNSNRTTTYVSSTQLTATIPASDLTAAGTFSITVFNPAPGGGTSNAQTFTVNNPVPTTTSISPTSKTVGDSGFTLTVNGTNFVSTSVVKFDNSNRTTTYVSSTQLTATIPASDLTAAGTFSITVFNPTPGGGTSNAQTFTVNNPVPTTTSIDPTGKTMGDSGFTLTVNGTLFISSSVVRFNGSDRTTTFVNSTTLTAAIPASDLTSEGTFPITVFNPTPGGGESNSQTFTVSSAPNPVPTTTSISPTSKNAGDSGFTLTVNGTNFVSGSVVKFDDSNRTTTYVSSTQLTATIPASDLVTGGTFSITVFNSAPGGGTSNAQTFTVNNLVPTTTSISPDTKTVYDSGFTLTVNGTNFVSTSVVKFGSSNRTTTYVSSTQLTATITASDLTTAGTFSITVFNPAPGGGTSNAQTFTVNNPVPTTTSIDPTGKTVGDSQFTMTVSGTLFISSSVVRFNGSNRTTTFVNSTTLTATIPASDLTSEGTFPITVFNPTPGGGESNSQTFTVSVTPPTPNPVPILTSISPSSATQNDSGFTMTLTGTDFVSTSVARFNGVSRTTTFVNSTTLTAAIPASDLTTAGNFPITVFTPSPGGGESGSKTFTIAPVFVPPTAPAPPAGEWGRPTTVIFSGKAFPGAKMLVVDKDIGYEKTVSQDTVTNDDGSFYTSFLGILQGPHSFGLVIKDREGRSSQSKFFNIDTYREGFVVKDLIIAPTVGFTAGSVTRGSMAVVIGYATPKSSVVVEIDGIIKKEMPAGQNGAYKMEINTGPLEFGSHKVRVKQSLPEGKGESDYSPLKNFIVSRVLLPKADFNDDGAVDIRDWSIFLFHWGSKDMKQRLRIDLNNDGKIDISDFSIFVRNIRKK